jgi:16S rRNA (adenine1518-N6/adenine1519-N6)-dimethyltransferase
MTNETNRQTLATITKELLASLNRLPSKRWGQHFLVDPQVLQRIINAAEVTKDDLVIEIGSGLGVLTTELVKRAGKVIAVEIDQELLRASKDLLKEFSNIEFVSGDILKTDLDAIIAKSCAKNIKIIGNLPYYITTPILELIFKLKHKPQIAVLMMQKEVAERISAKPAIVGRPGTKTYGSVSVFAQFYAEIELNSLVSKSSFHPWPEVSSAVVVLRPYQEPRYVVSDEKRFFEIVHAAFQQRRKQLGNSLADFASSLEASGIDATRRPETLSVEEFVRLANA